MSTVSDDPTGRPADAGRSPAEPPADHATALRRMVGSMGFEVMPLKATEDAVARVVPLDVPLTVTTTAAKGLDVTVGLAERLRARGYHVAPHLAARQVRDADELGAILERLSAAGIDRSFVVGGDAAEAAGPYPDALALLRGMAEHGHDLSVVGIGGYPEGHGSIPHADLDAAIRAKAPLATRIVTQICFDAATTVAWGEGLVRQGVALPVYVGMPGPVNRQKLIRISAGIGLGQSARFLQKQAGLWRFFLPGAYDPTKLVRRLARESAQSQADIAGLHIFTFNELDGAVEWRRRLRAEVGLETAQRTGAAG